MNAAPKHRARPDDRDSAHTPEPAPTPVASGRGSYDPAGRASGESTAAFAASNVPDSDEVLNVDGVARLFHVGRNTIYDLVGRNEIPHRRLGKQIRFSRAAIMRWLDPWSSQDAKEGQ